MSSEQVSVPLERQHDKIAHLVNRSGFHSRWQNSSNWISSMTRWTGNGVSQESSGQVVLRHGPMAQVLWERRERKRDRDGRIRGSILVHTGHQIRQENYTR